MDQENDKNAIASDLENLRRVNNSKAYMSLIGLFSVFVISISFFLFSNSIFSFDDTSGEDNLLLKLSIREVQVKTDLSSINAEIRRIPIDVMAIEAKLENLINPPDSGILATEDARLVGARRAQIDQLEKEKWALLTGVRLKEEESVVLEQELASIQSEKDSFSSEPRSKQLESVIETTITRFGAVMLAVFMMQILLTFFRYYTKLANFYANKMVAVRFIPDDDTDSLKSFAASLSVCEFDFGKNPELSMDKIIEIVKLSK